MDYAYYMRGLSNYTEGEGLLKRFIPTDSARPGSAIQSLIFVSCCSASRIACTPTMRARMIYLRNRLARYEINVANYYFSAKPTCRCQPRALCYRKFAANATVPDALAVMVQAYLLLGMDDLAEQSLAVLRKSYTPTSIKTVTSSAKSVSNRKAHLSLSHLRPV